LSSLGLDAVSASAIVRPDGVRLPLVLPGVRTAAVTVAWPDRGAGARVPGGFVLPVRRDPGGLMPDGAREPAGGPVPDGMAGPYSNGQGGGAEMWFLADGAAAPNFVGFFSGSWAVSADGTVLVLTGVVFHGYLTDAAVAAYRLPSLTLVQGPQILSPGYQVGPSRVVGVAGNAVVLEVTDPAGPSIGFWRLDSGQLRKRPFAYALDISRDGRVLVEDVHDRDYTPPAQGLAVPPERPCLNLVTVEQALATTPIGGACPTSLRYEVEASISPDGAWVLIGGGFSDYTPVDSEDDQNNAIVRTAELIAGRWSPTRQLPFAERSAVAGMPYVWVSDTTFVVQKSRHTLWDRLDPFGNGRSPAGYYLCGIDNTPCRPIDMPDALDSPRPMGRYLG
jgi:hypothetical protein